MGVGGAIALPRGNSGPGPGATVGGQNGTLALPSRLATATGDGTPARPSQLPPVGGQWGPVVGFRASFTRNNPWKLPLPRGLPVTHYIRQFFANIYPVVGYAAPVTATTGGTSNRAQRSAPPASPIPHNSRWWEWTFREEFDTRIWTVYRPRESFQPPLSWRRGVVQLQPGAVSGGWAMRMAYLPALTMWEPSQSYGATTPLLPLTVTPRAPSAASPARTLSGRYDWWYAR